MIHHDEAGLVASVKNNCKTAFNYLYQNYSHALFITIDKIIKDQHTSEDVLQETFVNIWVNINKYDPQKGRLFTWMLNIARNKAIDFSRRKVKRLRNITEGIETEETVYDAVIEQKTDNVGVAKLVSSLAWKYQQPVQLIYYKGYTLEEVSKHLNIPLGTIKTRVRFSLKALKNDFEYCSIPQTA